MLNPTSQILLERLLEILIGVITIFSFKLRLGNGGLSLKELVKELEEKDRQIERLRIEVHTWKLRYDHTTNGSKAHHLHNEESM